MRLLFDPVPPEGGAPGRAAPAPAPAPFVTSPAQMGHAPPGQPAQQPPAPPAPAPPPVPTVTMSAEDAARLYALRDRLATIETERESERRQREEAAALEQARRGELEQAFNAQRSQWEQRLAEVQTSYLNSETDRTIASAVAGFSFRSPAAAQQAQAILRAAVESRLENGRVAVVERGTGRNAADVIRERLGSPDFEHFLAPSGHAGTARPGQSPAAAAAPPAPPAADPRLSLDDAILAEMDRAMASPDAGFGLRPVAAPRATAQPPAPIAGPFPRPPH